MSSSARFNTEFSTSIRIDSWKDGHKLLTIHHQPALVCLMVKQYTVIHHFINVKWSLLDGCCGCFPTKAAVCAVIYEVKKEFSLANETSSR